jgi:hypothetical protein
MAQQKIITQSVSRRLPPDKVVVAAAALAVAQVAVVWLPGIPLGVPGEWTWSRIPYGGPEAATLFLRLFAVLPAYALYAGVCWMGDTRFVSATRSTRIAWLTALLAFGFGLLWTIQDAPTYAYDRLGRDPLVLYFPSTSGYFTEAKKSDDFVAYLANYEQLMSRGDVLHLGTHPPGLIALHAGLLAVYKRSPPLVDATLALRPESVRETEELLAALSQAERNPLSRAELAELWGASLLIQLAVIAAIFPLYLCASRSVGPTAGWRAACLWPLVPAIAIFLPKSDVLYPLIGTAVLACWYRRVGCAGVQSSILAGILLWFGLTLSLALLPVALLASLLSLQQITTTDPPERRTLAITVARDAAIVAAVFAGLTLACYWTVGLNLVAVWQWNFRNHAAFYDEFQRTYWKWLLVNPIELAMAVGLPAAVAAVAGLMRRPVAVSVGLPVGIVMALLWLSGKNSGEAARLWLFLMPWFLWVGASCWNRSEDARRWRIILLLQALVGFLTSVRIGGFGFTELIRDFG